MKKIIAVLTLLLLIAASTFAQRLAIQQQPKEFYLQKAEKQMKAGWILLGVGTAGVVTGVILGSQKTSSNEIYSDENIAGYVLLIGGLAVDLCSIPLFVSASNNRKRAASISVGLQGNDPLQRSPFTTNVQPAVILRINL
jgi:hypothetical protein